MKRNQCLAEIRREKSPVSFADSQRRKIRFFSQFTQYLHSQSVVGLWHIWFRYSGNPNSLGTPTLTQLRSSSSSNLLK